MLCKERKAAGLVILTKQLINQPPESCSSLLEAKSPIVWGWQAAGFSREKQSGRSWECLTLSGQPWEHIMTEQWEENIYRFVSSSLGLNWVTSKSKAALVCTADQPRHCATDQFHSQAGKTLIDFWFKNFFFFSFSFFFASLYPHTKL